MANSQSRSFIILSVAVLCAALLMGEDFFILLKRDARGMLPKEAVPFRPPVAPFVVRRQEEDVPANLKERAPLDPGCNGQTCNFLSYACDHNQTQDNYYACACSASYLKSYQLCFSNCTHIPPYSLYRDFCISNGWFNNNNINGTTQNVNNGTSSGNNSTKPGSALGYPTRGCMTNQCRKCITACDPGVLTYDQVTACTCNSTFLTLLGDCYNSCNQTAESPTARQAWCKKLADDAAAATKTVAIVTTTTTSDAFRSLQVGLPIFVAMLVILSMAMIDRAM